jgi:hypothetical protein
MIVAFSVRNDRELRHGRAKLAASNRCREILLPMAKKITVQKTISKLYTMYCSKPQYAH